MIAWSEFVELVGRHHRFVLVTHIRPDGDALGSLVAMGAILEHLGKDVLLANGFALPPSWKFLDVPPRFKQLGAQISAEEIEDREVLVILDTSAWAQLGPMADVVRRPRLQKAVLDHHVSGDDLGARMFKDVQAEATGRLVVEAADALGVPLTPPIATAVFIALATDTGWFRFASTTAATFRLAARLVEAGAVTDHLYKDLYENDSLGRLKLTGSALAHARTELDGRLIYTWLEQADFKDAGALPSDSEDLINLTLAVGGTEAAVILVEQPTGGFKVSFRSRCELDCARLAEQFGGGGHKKAAGATVPGSLETARTKVLDAVRAAMR